MRGISPGKRGPIEYAETKTGGLERLQNNSVFSASRRGSEVNSAYGLGVHMLQVNKEVKRT